MQGGVRWYANRSSVLSDRNELRNPQRQHVPNVGKHFKKHGTLIKFLFLTGLVFIIACQSNNSKTNAISKVDSKQDITIDKLAQDKESVKTVIGFLNWYKKNYAVVNQIILVNNCGEDFDSTKFYSVNFNATEKYLKLLNSSGFISEIYLQEWRDYFKKQDEYLKKNPQNDGPPYGFEYDLVLLTQEIDVTIDAITNPQIIDVKETNNNSTVKIDIMMKLNFSLSKIKGKWLIGHIDNLGIE